MTRQQVPNYELARDTARSNLLTNGGMEIWQRGAGPFTATGYTADRWSLFLGAGSTASVTKDSSNGDPLGLCLAVNYTHAAASEIYQDAAPPGDLTLGQLALRTLTVSMRVKATVNGGTVYISGDGGTTRVSSAPYSGSGVYQTLTATLTMPASPSRLRVGFTLGISGIYYLDNATLVVGSVAADYAPLHPADDLARCLRYYEKLTWVNPRALGLVQGVGSTATTAIPFKLVEKAVAPTVTQSGGFNIQVGSGASIGTTPQLVASTTMVHMNAAATVTEGTVYQMYQASGSSQIVLEANP